MADKERTLYDEMIRDRMEIAALIIRILNHYDSSQIERRMTLLYDATKKAFTEKTEFAVDNLEKVVGRLKQEMLCYKNAYPRKAEDDGLKERLSELEKLPIYSKL